MPYYLNEDNHWGLDISELERSIKAGHAECVPRAIVIINPGNPTGIKIICIDSEGHRNILMQGAHAGLIKSYLFFHLQGITTSYFGGFFRTRGLIKSYF